ncbi:cation diffusion facilitator family transporter [Thalassiella azotivora]
MSTRVPPAPGHRHDDGPSPVHHDDHQDHDHAGGRRRRVRHALVPHAHDHGEVIQTAEESSRVGIRAAWVSLVGMGATAVLQLVIVALSGSVALLADTVHNVGHLATTIPLLIAFRMGRRPATRRYAYGYRRAEDLVGLLISGVIALSAALIIWESVRALVHPRELTHLGWVLAAAVVGAAGNEAVARYRIRAGRRIGSAALVAEGQHARTDALTSLAVVVGVGGAWAGMPWLDAAAGLLIAAVVVAVLVATLRVVVRRLMDGVDEEVLDRVGRSAAAVPGVLGVDRTRARWSGHRLEADLDVRVDASLSVVDGHRIAHDVHEALRRRVPHLDHATVHVNPAGAHPAGSRPA